MNLLRLLILLAAPPMAFWVVNQNPGHWLRTIIIGTFLLAVFFIFRPASHLHWMRRVMLPLLLWWSLVGAMIFFDHPVRALAAAVVTALVLTGYLLQIIHSPSEQRYLRSALAVNTLIIFLSANIFYGAISLLQISVGWMIAGQIILFIILTMFIFVNVAPFSPAAIVWLAPLTMIFAELAWAISFLPLQSFATAALAAAVAVILWAVLIITVMKRWGRRALILFTVLSVCAILGTLLLARWL